MGRTGSAAHSRGLPSHRRRSELPKEVHFSPHTTSSCLYISPSLPPPTPLQPTIRFLKSPFVSQEAGEREREGKGTRRQRAGAAASQWLTVAGDRRVFVGSGGGGCVSKTLSRGPRRCRETPVPGVQREHNLQVVDNLGPGGPVGPAGGLLADRRRGQGGGTRSAGWADAARHCAPWAWAEGAPSPRFRFSILLPCRPDSHGICPARRSKTMVEKTSYSEALATTRLHASLLPSPFCHLPPTPPPHPPDTQSSNAPWDPLCF